MSITHCDYKFPLKGGYEMQLEIRASTMTGINVGNRDCELTMLSSIKDHDYLITVDFVDGVWGCRHYSNGRKLPKKYKEYADTLIKEHLLHFPEIKINL